MRVRLQECMARSSDWREHYSAAAMTAARGRGGRGSIQGRQAARRERTFSLYDSERTTSGAMYRNDPVTPVMV